MYSSPITGASGRVLLSHLRFLLAAPGFYSRFVDIRAFHHLPALWMQPETLLVPSRLLLYHMALVVPPSFVDASRHQPCRVLTYSSPITGATGKGLLSHLRFLLAAPGFYSRFVDIRAFHHLPALWMQPETLLVPSRLLLYHISQGDLKVLAKRETCESVIASSHHCP